LTIFRGFLPAIISAALALINAGMYLILPIDFLYLSTFLSFVASTPSEEKEYSPIQFWKNKYILKWNPEVVSKAKTGVVDGVLGIIIFWKKVKHLLMLLYTKDESFKKLWRRQTGYIPIFIKTAVNER
jgi:hypothetical protein